MCMCVCGVSVCVTKFRWVCIFVCMYICVCVCAVCVCFTTELGLFGVSSVRYAHQLPTQPCSNTPPHTPAHTSLTHRNEYKDVFEKKHGVKLGFMSVFVKASAQALVENPIVNAGMTHTHPHTRKHAASLLEF